MTEAAAPRRARLLSIGSLAGAALVEGAAGRIAAVFQSSLYLEIGPAWLCLGPPALGDGPLNLLADLAVADLAGLAIDGPVRRAGDVLRLGTHLELDLSAAETWRPPPVPNWDRDSLRRSLAWLDREVAAGRLAIASPLLGADPSACGLAGCVAETAGQAIAGLEAWLTEAWETRRRPSEREAELAARLIGLGPGLTPAGDDFLGGLLLALIRVGRADLAERLALVLLPLAPARSHPISCAHLRAAARGQGGAGLLAALDALLAGRLDELAARLAAVGRIGHSSGWDALAGLLLVLRSCRAVGQAADQGEALLTV